MHPFRLVALLAAPFVVWIGFPGSARATEFTNTIAVMTSYITNQMPAHGVSGLSIALVESNAVVWSQGFGLAVVESNLAATAQTVYRIGSVSKVFTAACVLKLWEDGQVELEAPFTNYIPDFAILPRFPGTRTPTVRECLNHQSGFPGDMFRNAFATEPWDGYNAWLLGELATDYPNYPAGFRSIYCNTGFQLAEELVGRVAGVSLNDYAQSKFFGPLGMTSTSYLKDKPNIAARLAHAYRSGLALPEEFVNAYGTGGMYSSVEDMAALLRMILAEGRFNGTNVLATHTVAAMLANQATNLALDVDSELRFGLGWDTVSKTPLNYAGRLCFKDGQPFTYYCAVGILLDRQLGVVVMQSSSDALPTAIADETLKQAVFERDGLAPPPYTPPVSAETNWSPGAIAAVTGLYVTLEGMESGLDLLAAAPDGSLTWTLQAHTESPTAATGLVPHADGWIYATDQSYLRMLPTNLAGRAVLIWRMEEDYGEVQAFRGDLYSAPPIPAAWSNRLNVSWLPVDMPTPDLYWTLAKAGRELRLRMTNRLGLIWLTSPSGHFVIAPSNDTLGFAAGSAVRRGASVVITETNGAEHLRFSSYTYRRADTFPALSEGTTSNGTLPADQVQWFTFNAVSGVYYGVTISNREADILLNVGFSGWSANGGGWTCPSNAAYPLGLSSTSATPFSLRLYTLTSTIARVSSLVTNLMAENNLVGCGLSLVDGGHTVWQTGFGHADFERGIPADESTVFMIGSCTKTFGAVAALQLVEQGRLELDAPLTNALPSFAIHQRFPDNVITLRTILTHHSGLPGDIFNYGFTVRPNYGAPDTIEGLLADEYTLLPTNTLWSYNNSGFVMLGQAFRHITGGPLAGYARTNLFDRMAMTNSSLVRDLPYIESHLARPYLGGQVRPDEYVNLFYAGSIYSTASDMARYLRMLLAGGMGDNARVISEASLAGMSTLQNADIPLDRFSSLMNMGIGFLLDPPWLNYMGKVIWHDGSTAYFHTLLRVATDAQLGCFISCNTSETGGANEEIVDSALRWAYEEKTGVAPPPPCFPGTPAPGAAPADVIALATGGVFVTGTGLDRFSTNDTGLLYLAGVQRDGPSELALTYRENGWFTPTNGYEPQIVFTQAVGRILCLVKSFDNGVTNLSIRGERAAGINGFHPAWSNRLGRWWATNLHPDDIAWLLPGLLINPMTELYAKEDILLLVPGGWRDGSSYVLAATNDALAFAAGLGRNKGSALRADGDALAFLGIRYRSASGIPGLPPGASTNGTTAGDETSWYFIPAPTGQPFTVDLASDHDITAWLYNTNGLYLGQANRAHAFRLDASRAQPLMAAVVRDGAGVGSWRLTLHTNATPFFHFLPADQWPSELIALSNLYGSLEFGHVFVPENRTNAAGNILKIAVARMRGPDPAAPPIFFCEGGPGDSSIRCAYQYYMKAFTNEYDVYLVDQRGIGYSQPDLTLRAQEVPTALQYRLAMLQGGDLSAMNTIESSYDLDDLAAALALTNVNLHGISYGTLLAQTLLRREPDWLRAVVLDGVMAPNITPFSQTGPIRDNALNALFADIAAHPQASAWYPNFPAAFYALADELQTHPVTLQYESITNQVDGLAYLDAVLQQMTVSDLGARERIPSIVYRASAGETEALDELYTAFTIDSSVLPPNVMSEMMQMLVVKHDILPFDSMEAASNACAGLPPLLRQLNLNFMQQVVDRAGLLDPAGQADPSFILPVTSAIPTLVINGAYDTQTGTNWAAEVASHLPNAFLVTVPTVGHGVLYGGDCPLQTIRNFLANPWADPKPECLASMALDFSAPWPTNATWMIEGVPQTSVVDEVRSGAWYRFAAVSGLVYSLDLNSAAGGYILRVTDTNAQTIGSAASTGLEWISPASGPAYLWMIPQATGLFSLQVNYPLLVRGVSATSNGVALTWQSQTNGTYDLWTTTNLTDDGAWVKAATNLQADGWLTSAAQTSAAPFMILSPRRN